MERDIQTRLGNARALDETVAVSAVEIAPPRGARIAPKPAVATGAAPSSERSAPSSERSASGTVTHRFVRQHEELSVVAKELMKHLDSVRIAEDPAPVRRMLASFSGKLRVHAAMEQEALYPRLLASSDSAVRDKANELLEEVGDLYELFFRHLSKWSDGPLIRSDAEGFCRETMQLFHRLKVRMKRENEELYPMVDGPAGR